MSSEESKNLNLRWIKAFNESDLETEAACRTANYLAHMSGAPGPLDTNGWGGFMQTFASAFPDAHITVEDSVSEGSIVASRWTLTGTHRGEFQGVPATGRSIKITGIDFSRVEGNQISEHWAQFDLVALMQQIVALPGP